MLRRCSRHRKEKDGGTETTEVEDLKEGLSERLFATDRFPSERVNMYSTVDLLLAVRDALNDTSEMGEHESGGGGDAEYPLYVHSEIDAAKKRRAREWRGSFVDAEKYAAMGAHVEELGT
ncbi:hypothetical protein IGI04_031719 [Brassica rapa subsp. trilocularis]|uniref:Uncharacterized protein n=1 Tax=Brassica rapa subsp. trilocularis TaxID=1813537 RepID=A0ABQ7LWX5_BRACM|nr:hypothetical protein IGI04_031719 [Brassica rapa subsp. trilocularis]